MRKEKKNKSLTALLLAVIIKYIKSLSKTQQWLHQRPSGAPEWTRPQLLESYSSARRLQWNDPAPSRASTPKAFSAQHRLEPLQMAPDFRHPSMHPLFFLNCAAARSLMLFCFHIYLLFCNPFRDRQSLSISFSLPHFSAL